MVVIESTLKAYFMLNLHYPSVAPTYGTLLLKNIPLLLLLSLSSQFISFKQFAQMALERHVLALYKRFD